MERHRRVDGSGRLGRSQPLRDDVAGRILDDGSLSAGLGGGPTEPRFWRSDDGIEWTSTESFTFEPSTTGDAGQADATYHKIGDDHWIVGFNAAHAWRSTDTVEWNPVIGPRSSEGGPRSDRFSGELYDAGGQALWIDRTGLAYWFSPDTETWIPDPDVVVPQRSASPATIDRRVVIAGERELSVSTPIGTTQVPLPWTSEVADIEGVGDSFVAYVGSRITECCFEFYTGRELTLEQIWTSTDGIDWDGPLVPEFLDGPSPALFISNDGVGAVLTRPENWTTSELWTTSDWRAWTETGVTPTPNDGDAVTFGSGALLLDQVGDRLWYSPDIETWHEVPLDEFGLDDGWRSDREYIATTDDLAYLVRSVAVYDESDEFAGYQTDVRIIHRPSPHRQDLV